MPTIRQYQRQTGIINNMVSTRDAVIASLKTKLETITTGNGYQQNIGDVLDYPVQMADLDGYDFPIISIVMGSNTNDPFIGGAEDYLWNVGLRCYLEDVDTDNVKASVNEMIEDVNKLIFTDPTLGNASVVETNISMSGPPFIWTDLGTPAICDIQLQIRYRKTF